jgi:glutaredoxin
MDRRKVLLALAAVMGMVLVGPVRRPADAYNSSTWYEDAGGFEQALRQQRALHAPVLVYFRVDWCPHCRTLDQMLERYEVRSRLNELIKVRINPEHGDAEKQLFQTGGSGGYPSLFLRREGGGATQLHVGGSPEQFLAQFPK